MTDPKPKDWEDWEDWKESLVDALIEEATKAIEKAVLAERERCAKLFDIMEGEGLLLGANQVADIIRQPPS